MIDDPLIEAKSITGSCGGISNLGMDKACDCPDPCDKRKAKIAKAEAKQKMLSENRII